MDSGQVTMYKRNVSIKEVERVLLKMSTTSTWRDDYKYFLFCSEYNRPSFYKNLMAEYGVSVRFFSTTSIMQKIASHIIGTQAIIEIKDDSKLSEVFLRISEQAMASIYVYADSNTSNVIDLVLLQSSKIDEVVMAGGNYFKYLIDEDSAQSGDDIMEVVEFGKLFPREFIKSLGILAE